MLRNRDAATADRLYAALVARASALLPDVPEDTRRSEAEGTLAQTPGREGDAPGRDAVQEALERAERTVGVAERDAVYAHAAVTAAWAGDPRAQVLLDKINDSDLARRARRFADLGFVRAALRKNDAEAAARASKGELRRVERAWAYERAAALLYKTDRARAVALLEEAAAEARRIDNTDPDRARALVAVATLYVKIDRPRAWDILAEAARAANSAPDFTGEDGRLFAEFKSGRGGWMTDNRVPEFDLRDIMTTFAAEDWNRAVQLAESFTGEAARANAVITAARTALAGKGK